MAKVPPKIVSANSLQSTNKKLNLDVKLSVLLFVLAFFQYIKTINYQYVWDDKIVITQNAKIQKGFAGIPSLFLKYNTYKAEDQYGYRPITLMAFAIEYQIFGLNPKAGHFFNVFYFSLLCWVLFKVLRKIFSQYTAFAPFVICLLFIVHPIHVEVVANIKSRDEIFALLFSLISLNYLLRYNEYRQIKNLIFCILTFMIAYLSKESAFTYLFIMPLTLLYVRKWQISKQVIISSISSLVLIVICLIIVKSWRNTSLGGDAWIDVPTYYTSNLLGNSFFYTTDFIDKMANALTVMMLYVKNFLYPLNLVYYYGYNQIPLAKWSDTLVIFSFVFHVALFFFAVLKIKKYATISFAIFFYLISILFYSHIALPLADTMADRFFFAPSLPFIILLVFAGCKLFKIKLEKSESSNAAPLFNNFIFSFKSVGLIVILLFFSITTFSRSNVWKDQETLITTDMPALENCSQAHWFYANYLKQKIGETQDLRYEQEMVYHFKRSIEITDSAYYSYMALASYYTFKKDYKSALDLLKHQEKNYAYNADLHYYLGDLYLQMNEIKKGIYHLEKSMQLAPGVTIVYAALAKAYTTNKEFDKALRSLKTMENKTGENSIIFEGLANVYYSQVIADSIALNNIHKGIPLPDSLNALMQKSTDLELKALKYEQNPAVVYSTIIERYKSINDFEKANFYYSQAVQYGILPKK